MVVLPQHVKYYKKMHKESDLRLPLILGDKSYKDITDDIIRPIEAKAPKLWYLLFAISIIIALWGIGCIVYLLGTGGNINKLHKMAGLKEDKPITYLILNALYKKLTALTYQQRIVKSGLNPDRADVILPAMELSLIHI